MLLVFLMLPLSGCICSIHEGKEVFAEKGRRRDILRRELSSQEVG